MITTDTIPLRHDALFYDGIDQLVDQLLPFARNGISRNDSVVAVLPPDNLSALRDALGPDGADVEFIDATEWYRRPVSTIAGYHQSLTRKTALGHPLVRVIGEVQFGSTADEWRSWTRYEAALNRAFETRPAWIVCPYDTRTLPEAVLADARRTHPHLHAGDDRSPSPEYRPADEILASLPVLPQVAGPPAITLDIGEAQHRVRTAIAALARRLRFDETRIAEVVLSVAEIAANARMHGGGRATLRAWAEPDQLVCEIADDGPGDINPLAGYLPPEPRRPGGRGLWITRQLADQVELQLRPGGGLSAWLRFTRGTGSGGPCPSLTLTG
jgi:anti-sigma regulatory factor (Ser/Thr protein kinase)